MEMNQVINTEPFWSGFAELAWKPQVRRNRNYGRLPTTRESAITELRDAVPSFTSEWDEDRPSYHVFNDFGRFICSEAELCNM
jgi:hypothetical protein